MDNGQVAVQADAGQEEDPTVEVDLRIQRIQSKISLFTNTAYVQSHTLVQTVFDLAHLLP